MAFALEGRDDRLVGWFSFSLTPVRDELGAVAGFLVVVVETTETVLLQRRQSFDLELDQVLRQRTVPSQMFQAATRLLGTHLHVAHCAYAEADESTGLLTVQADWSDGEAPGLSGAFPLAALPAGGLAALRACQAVLTSGAEPSGSFLHRAAVLAPVVKEGRLAAVLIAGQDAPRRWTADDEALVRTVAERIWAAAAQARTEEENQELRRTLEVRVAERTAERDRLWRSAQELILVVGADQTFVSVNPASQTVLGFTPGQMLGRSPFDFMHPADWPQSRDRMRTYEPGEIRYTENRYRHADGSYRTLAWNVVFEDSTYYATGRDVTAERASLAALQASEARLRAIFETSYQLKWLLDLDGRIVSANGIALEAAGHVPVLGVEFWASAWFDATPGMDQSIRTAVLAARSGEQFRAEVELELPEGPRQFDLSIRPIHDLEGAVIAIVPEALEITGRRATEEALRQSQKMEAVGQLTGGLAHDFNNLLTGIGGALERIGTRLAQGRPAEVSHYLDAAAEATRRAGALTHRLLAFSRRQTLSPRRLDANQLVAGMADLIRRTVGPAITVVVQNPPDLPPVLADANQLENAILNLCLNARDAMPGGGTLTIRTRTVPHEADMPAGPLVALGVSDTGSGMTAEVAGRAFDPFFTTKPLGTGTGLGLSMVYGFAQQSGGGVRITSSPGTGTEVTLYFPALPGEADPLVQPGALPPVPGRGETVLVVEDEEPIRLLMEDVLHDHGYTVLSAENGAAALARLGASIAIDLMVTDIGLPGGMNGRELSLAARKLRPGLPILMMTGFAPASVLGDRRLEPGMAIMTKPFTMAALTIQIQELLAAQ